MSEPLFKKKKRKTAKFDLTKIDTEHFLEVMKVENLTRATEEEWLFSCPFTGHAHGDQSPSAYMNDETTAWMCHGCLPADEEVLTDQGYVSIADASLGDYVLGVDGHWHLVSECSELRGDLLCLRTGIDRDGLRMTDDHVCLRVPMQQALGGVVGLVRRRDAKAPVKLTGRTISVSDSLRLDPCLAREVERGDFFVTPVARVRSLAPLLPYKRKTIHGPQDRRVAMLPISLDDCWAYGLWLAEGSFSTRGVRIDMHEKERGIVERWLRVMKCVSGSTGTISARKGSRGIYATVNNVDLAALLELNFGRGCAGKRIPGQAFLWPAEHQAALLDGYIDGDGTEDRTRSITVSRRLAYGLAQLAIQCGRRASVSSYEPQLSEGVKSRQTAYSIGFPTRDSIRCFFAPIGNITFCWTMVEGIEEDERNQKVYDIGVQDADSFVTKTSLVHNCKRSGNAITFYEEYENVTRQQARHDLQKRYGGKSPDPDEYSVLADLERMWAKAEREREVVKPNAVLDDSLAEEWSLDWAAAERVVEEGEEIPEEMQYMFDRGFDAATLDDWQIGWDENHERIMIPIYGVSSLLFGFKGRAVHKDRKPKYMVMGGEKYDYPRYEKSQVVFGLDRVAGKYGDSADIILCEGELDVISMHSKGFDTAVCVAGSDLSQHQARLLRRWGKSVTIFFDSDDGGNFGTRKAIDGLHSFLPLRVVPDHEGDPADLDKEEIAELIRESETVAKAIVLSKGE